MKKREQVTTRANGLLEQLRIGTAEARVHAGTLGPDVVRAVKLGTRGDGTAIDVHQEPITDDNGEQTDVDVVARIKTS